MFFTWCTVSFMSSLVVLVPHDGKRHEEHTYQDSFLGLVTVFLARVQDLSLLLLEIKHH
jgi:hypothetical protein